MRIIRNFLLNLIDTRMPITISDFTFIVFGSIFPVSLFLSFSDVSLNSFSKRIIGIAVLDLIDVNRRTLIYILATIFFFLLSIFWYLLICQQKKKCEPETQTVKRNPGLELISSLGILITLWQGFAPSKVQLFIIDLLFIYAFVIFITQYSSNQQLKLSDKGFKLFSYNLLISAIVAINIVFTLMLFKRFSIRFDWKYAILFVVLVVFLFMLLRFFFNNRNILYQQTIRALVPVSTIAGLLPLIQEAQFTFADKIPNLKILVLFATTFLIVISLLIFFFKPKKTVETVFDFTKKAVENRYIPILLFTVLIFIFHNQYMVFGDLDYFHLGERLISNQQLFQFGRIPFLDILPTHGMSSMFYQVLYSVINGYKPFAPYIWHWMATIPMVIIAYYFLRKFVNVWYGLVVILLLPFDWILGSEFAVFLLIALIIYSYKNPFWQRHQLFYWLLSYTVVFLFFLWKIDFGIVNLISFSAILVFLIIRGKKDTKFNIDFRPFSIAFLIFSIVLIVCGLTLINASTTPLNEIVQNLVDFLSMQGQSQGYSLIVSSENSLAYYEYFFTPLVGIAYLLYFIYLLFSKDRIILLRHFSLVFLAICSLGISIRTLQRHAAVEMFYPAFTTLLILLLPFYLNHKHPRSNYLFSLLLFSLVVIGLSPTRKDSYLERFFQRILPDQGYNFVNWKPDESRVIFTTVENQKTLTNYLKDNLKENQTFLDLTNRPLLYVLAEKEFPYYLIPVIYNSTEDIQRIETSKFQKLNDQGLMPLTIVKGPPGFWADHVDFVDNEIRNYRLFEFAYNNYYPYAEIDQNIVLKAKDLLPSSVQPNESSTIMRPALHQLRNLPYVWANFDPYGSIQNTAVLVDLSNQIVGDGRMDSGVNHPFKITSKFEKTSGSYLHLSLTSGPNVVASVCLDLECKSGFEFITQEGTDIDYLVRMSSDWFWQETNIDTIYIKVSESVFLNSLKIRGGD